MCREGGGRHDFDVGSKYANTIKFCFRIQEGPPASLPARSTQLWAPNSVGGLRTLHQLHAHRRPTVTLILA
jgi:hypothetical protein